MRNMKSSIAVVGLTFTSLVLTITSPISAKKFSPYKEGRKLFAREFNPENYFGFDYNGVRHDRSIGSEELILTVKVSARDGYLPEYALAIAHACRVNKAKKDELDCDYEARMLRVKSDKENSSFHYSSKILKRSSKARGAKQRRRMFKNAKVEWMQTRLWADCKPAIEIMDQLATKADWKPSLHYTRIKMKDRELVLHPAQMWITMNGNEQISSWKGWRNGNGAAYGVRLLLEELDKCWKPSDAPPPWSTKKRG